MMNNYEYVQKMTSMLMDDKSVLRLECVFALFQDATTEHSHQMGVDHDRMMENSNAFWVLSKIKLRADGLPKSGHDVKIKTWPRTPGGIRFLREYTILGECTDVKGRAEWCLLDAETQRLRRFDSVAYPQMEHDDSLSGVSDFRRLRESVTEADLVYTHVALYTDIDCNAHVNNLAYARMALNAFTPSEMAENCFNTFEVHFVSQSFYGNAISIYRKQVEGGYYVEGKTRQGEKDGTVFTAFLSREQ